MIDVAAPGGGLILDVWYERTVEILKSSWWFFLLFILLTVAFSFLYGLLIRALKKREKKISGKIGAIGYLYLQRTVRFLCIAGFVFISLCLLSFSSAYAESKAAALVRRWVYALLLVYLIYLLARAVTMGIDNLYRGQMKKEEEKRLLPDATITLVRLLLKYITLFFFTIMGVVVLISALGQYELVAEGFKNFVANNASYLAFLLVLVGALVLTSKFVRAFTRDMRRERGTLSDQMVETLGKTISFFLYFVVGLIIVFTLLSMANMQDVGSTLIIIFSTMVGLIVAMAATGSIGNILSGLVLQSTKPYEIGDRAKVARDLLGDIVSTSLFFTRIRTLNNEVVTVPNNYVLSDEIVNYSRSSPVGIEVRLSVGYDVHPATVRRLLKEAALSTKGIVRSPRPQALAESFQDHAISYLLRAFTNLPKRIPQIRSLLIENIYDSFYSRGIEILSPGYIVKREEELPGKENTLKRYERSKQERSEEPRGELLRSIQ